MGSARRRPPRAIPGWRGFEAALTDGPVPLKPDPTTSKTLLTCPALDSSQNSGHDLVAAVLVDVARADAASNGRSRPSGPRDRRAAHSDLSRLRVGDCR